MSDEKIKNQELEAKISELQRQADEELLRRLLEKDGLTPEEEMLLETFSEQSQHSTEIENFSHQLEEAGADVVN